MSGAPPERSDLIRLAAIVELLIQTAQRVDGDLVSEAHIADLYELRERTYTVLQSGA
ncbi:MAG TPA: hypothetical protein VJ838_04780 [Gaiellaceae bacterium]|nr:hypothetical protein [Gaiellaceae bacterium]